MTNTAKGIMVTRLVTLTPGTPVSEAIRRLIHSHVKGAPVVDEQLRYLGIFTERCCLNVLARLYAKHGWPDMTGGRAIASRDIMTKRLLVLRPETDAFDAVNTLLRHKVSGAPVVDRDQRFLGMFSETNSMSVLLGAIYDSLPGTQVSSYMDPDPGRQVPEDLSFEEIVAMFRSTAYRRLAVIREDRVVGQVSRHNVLSRADPLVQKLAESDQASERSWTAAAFMDSQAKTIDESMDLFSIASIFQTTKQRRLPVLREGRLVGQITRKNLLNAANDILNQPASKTAQPLYLASVPDASPPET